MFRAFVFLSLLACDVAYAAGDSSAGSNVWGGYIFALLWAAATRKRPIGGWLFCFYMQVAAGALITAFTVPATLPSLAPSKWGDTRIYVLFMLSAVPVFVLGLAQWVAAAWLLFKRDEQGVRRMRLILLALICAGGVAVVLDMLYFRQDILFDTLETVYATIWLAYFYRSERVRRVFIARDWPQPPSRSPAEVRYLNRRALLFASVIFVLTLGTEYFTWDVDSRTDGMILMFPTILAVLAGLLGRFLDLSTSKRAKLAGTSVASVGSTLQPPTAE